MKWTVIYKPSAHSELADIGLNAPDRQAVADAADEIDRLLKNSPIEASESRSGKTRVLIRRPLTVLFDLNEDDALITVLAMNRWRRTK